MNALQFASFLRSETNRYASDFTLPDYLYDENGNFDRERTIDLLLSEEYGYVHDEGVEITVEKTKEPAFCVAEKARETIRFRFTLKKGTRSASFPVDLFLPLTEDDNCPLIVNLDFAHEQAHCPVYTIMEQSVRLAHIYYQDVTTDNNDFENGIAPLLSDRNAPGAAGKIAIWAYAAYIVGRFLLEEGYAKKGSLYVAGHSRLGKTALLCAALYPIFNGAHTNASGCSGAAIARDTHGETVKQITTRFPFWFTPAYEKYSEHEEEMPFDQHYLMALIAPRKISVVTAEKDAWADTEAQYLCAEAASVIYEKCGVVGLDRTFGLMKTGDINAKGCIGFSMRHGVHHFNTEDWIFFIQYIKGLL